jgi:hypothetical protein
MKQLLSLLPTMFLAFNCMAQPGSGYARDAVHDKYEKDNAANKQKGMDWMANMMNAKTEPEYNFTTSMTMRVTDYKDGEKKGENDMQYFVNASKKYFAAKMTDNNSKRKNNDVMFIIYDYDNNSSIMLNEKEKTGMAININAFMSKEAQENRGKGTTKEGEYKSDCKKSGKTKNIQGYSCEEYVCIDEDRNRRNEIWIANKLPNISQSLSRSPYAYMGNMGMTGMMMEGTFYKNNQIDSKIEVIELNPKADITVKMSDYKMVMR